MKCAEMVKERGAEEGCELHRGTTPREIDSVTVVVFQGCPAPSTKSAIIRLGVSV